MRKDIAIMVNDVMFGKGDPKKMMMKGIERIAKLYNVPVSKIAKIATEIATFISKEINNQNNNPDTVIN